MLTSRRTLGLAASQQAITVAEVHTTRGKHRLVYAAQMPLDEGALQDAPRLGKAIKDFLRAHHVSASHCVIGVEASFLAAKEKRLPAAAAASMADILRLATEQDFASDGQELLFDYAPSPDTTTLGALLVAAPRAVVDQWRAAAESAGLNVSAITSTAVALAGATAPAGDRVVVSLSSGGTELVVQSQGSPRRIRRLGPNPGSSPSAEPASRQRYLGELEAELRRLLAGVPADAQGAPPELWVWNGAGVDEAALREIGQRLGAPLRVCGFPADLAGLDGMPPADCPNPAPAAALAMGPAGEGPLALDFLHSRLTIQKQHRLGKVALWGGLAAAVLIAAGVWLGLDWRSKQREIGNLNATLAATNSRVLEANDTVTRASFALGWYDHRPKFMDCLREVALAFPLDQIWATNLIVKDDMHVVLSGKATGESVVIDLMGRLGGNRRLTDVKPLYIRQVGGGSRDVSFAINFTYVGAR